MYRQNNAVGPDQKNANARVESCQCQLPMRESPAVAVRLARIDNLASNSNNDCSSHSAMINSSNPNPKLAFAIVSFFLGELGDGLNIFQGIYLVSIGWNEGSVGIALSAMGFTALLVQTLAGDVIDKTHFDRRTFLALASIATAFSASAILFVHEGNTDHALMYVTKIVEGISSSFIAPCVAALVCSLVSPSSSYFVDSN